MVGHHALGAPESGYFDVLPFLLKRHSGHAWQSLLVASVSGVDPPALGTLLDRWFTFMVIAIIFWSRVLVSPQLPSPTLFLKEVLNPRMISDTSMVVPFIQRDFSSFTLRPKLGLVVWTRAWKRIVRKNCRRRHSYLRAYWQFKSNIFVFNSRTSLPYVWRESFPKRLSRFCTLTMSWGFITPIASLRIIIPQRHSCLSLHQCNQINSSLLERICRTEGSHGSWRSCARRLR